MSESIADIAERLFREQAEGDSPDAIFKHNARHRKEWRTLFAGLKATGDVFPETPEELVRAIKDGTVVYEPRTMAPDDQA